MATTTTSIPDLGLYGAPYVIVLPDLPLSADCPLGYSYDTPFSPTPDPDLERNIENSDWLREVFNAGHYSRFIAEGRRRYTQFLDLESKLALDMAIQEFNARIRGWRRSCEQGHGDNLNTQLAFEVGLEWGAKLICCLAKEVELLKGGHSVLRCSYENEVLPWQHMNLSM